MSKREKEVLDKTAGRLATIWRLSNEERAALMGSPPNQIICVEIFEHLSSGVKEEDQANWLRSPLADHAPFPGKSPFEVMQDGPQGLAQIRDYLISRLGR